MDPYTQAALRDWFNAEAMPVVHHAATVTFLACACLAAAAGWAAGYFGARAARGKS